MIDLSIICFGIRGVWKGLVYYVRGGKQNIRGYAVPYDPKTAPQLARRSVFAVAVALWKSFSEAEKQYWKDKSSKSGRSLPGYQFYLSWYLKHN